MALKLDSFPGVAIVTLEAARDELDRALEHDELNQALAALISDARGRISVVIAAAQEAVRERDDTNPAA